MATISNKKNGNMSLKEQMAMLENYNKVKAGQNAEQKALTFAPATKKKPTCAYCRKDGHWRRDNKTGKTTCPKLINKDKYALLNNAKKRARERSWQEQTSAKVERTYGEGGGSWQTAGSQDKTARKLEYKRPVVKVSNAYDFGEDEWNEVGAAKARADEVAWEARRVEKDERDAVVRDAKKIAEAAAAVMGRWNKPLSYGGVVKEESVDEAIKCPGCEDWGCQDCN
jgi:hypothetical protein